jgi:hypothetical protein
MPEEKAEKYPNLAKSPVRITVRAINITDNPLECTESEYDQMIRNILKKGIRRNPDYFPLDPDLTDELGFDVIIWDRREKESSGVVYESYDIDIPDKYLNS